MNKQKSQVSVEYMMIMGFVTLITIPLIIMYHTFTLESSDEINSAQVQQIGKKIVDAAESVYYLGEPSQTRLKVTMPDNIVLTNLSNNELVFRIRTKDGQSDIVRNSAVNITGTLPTRKGIYTIIITAGTNNVGVSYQ